MRTKNKVSIKNIPVYSRIWYSWWDMSTVYENLWLSLNFLLYIRDRLQISLLILNSHWNHEKNRFSDDFWGNRSSSLCLNSINIRGETWQRSRSKKQGFSRISCLVILSKTRKCSDARAEVRKSLQLVFLGKHLHRKIL